MIPADIMVITRPDTKKATRRVTTRAMTMDDLTRKTTIKEKIFGNNFLQHRNQPLIFSKNIMIKIAKRMPGDFYHDVYKWSLIA
jgi:hypothetical protein